MKRMSLLSDYSKEYKEWLRKKREEVRKIKQDLEYLKQSITTMESKKNENNEQ